MYCRQCGEQNEAENKFCLICGFALDPVSVLPGKPPEGKPLRKTKALLWIISIVVVCVLVCVYFAVQQGVFGGKHLTGPEYVIKNAEVVSFLFYEEGADQIPYGQREYSDRFTREEARYICWELLLEHPAPDHRIYFPITQVYYRPSGIIDGEDTYESFIDHGWIDSYHTWGLGWDEAGHWRTGTFTVELYINDYLIATGKFDIY